MKKLAVFLISYFICCSSVFSYTQIIAKVEIQEKALKQFQTIAKAELPFPSGGSVYVADINGIKLDSIRILRGEPYQRDFVYFKTNQNDEYYVVWLSEERKSDTSIFEIPEGSVIIDDYLNPSARTSGFWFWVSNPRLSGSFSHTGRSQQAINSHYTSLLPARQIKTKDIVHQYVFIDKNDPAEEIILEIQAQKRKSYYFSWGSDVIKWKGINKISMGQLPEKGRWALLIIPVEKMGKDIEITGIGFYNAGGRVFWDYTTIGNPILTTKVLEWKKKDSKVSAFYQKEIFGPFSFSGGTFYAGIFDGSGSTGTDTYLWDLDGRKYSGRTVFEKFDGKAPAYVSLACKNYKLKASDVFSETVIFQKKTAEDLNLYLKILPHKNLLCSGDKFYLPVQAGSLMSGIVPVEIVTGNKNELFKLVPGKENARNVDLFFSSTEPSEHKIELKIGDISIVKKMLKFMLIENISLENLDGVHLVDDQGARIVGLIPDYKFSDEFKKDKTEQLTIIGDFPSGFENMISKYFPDVRLELLRYPKTKHYHALYNMLWLKKQLGNRQFGTVILFPSLDVLLHRTPVDEYISSLDASIWFLSSRSKRIICLTPFPSAPSPDIFRPYAEATIECCKKRNIDYLDLYELYTHMPDWVQMFRIRNNVYGNFPSGDGIRILAERFYRLFTTGFSGIQ